MNIRIPACILALPIALLLAAGGANAQFKAQAKPSSGSSLGGGLNLGTASTPETPGAATLRLSAPAGSAAPAARAPSQTGTVDEKAASADAVVQEIADCVLAGLPNDWTMAQVDVREISRKDKQREFEAIYSFLDGEGKAGPFTPCDQKQPAMNVYKLNAALEPSKRNWVRATLVLSKEGKFELQYDYLDKDADKGPAPAATAKRDAKKAPAKKTPG